MPDPLTHFALPFALASPFFGVKTAFIIGTIALLPDFDVIFRIHRSFTHSIIFILCVCLPIMIFKRNKFTLMSFLALTSHLIMDMFQTYTPILYPLISESIHININAGIIIDQSIKPYLTTTLKFAPTNFTQFSSFNAPLFINMMLPIAMILILIPIITGKIYYNNHRLFNIPYNKITIVLFALNETKDIESFIDKIKSNGLNKIILVSNHLNNEINELAKRKDLIIIYHEDISKTIKSILNYTNTPYIFIINYDSKNVKKILTVDNTRVH
ncbi:MAG: metal-dependent hydrolase [Candidatus Methanomethyliaceae archaeon]|nr:metal-dependent hydrolase [Candidatus Methanomethyliaceae archaeon]